MMWQHVFRQWFVLVLVLASVTSCEFEQYGTGTALPAVECQPGEWEYKGQCVPAGLPPDMPCPPGETLLDDGRCEPAGLPLDMQCPPGELALDNGKCQPAGVPPEMCGEGFEPDGKMGCNAILPAEACPFGLMAVPGETECHEVAPCPNTTYPEFPLDPTHPKAQPTQFVNGAYAGDDSDGTRMKPWRTIQKGIDTANAGDIVAVAEGTYQENLFINKQLKLWGVCPKKVAVAGISTQNPTIEIFGTHADGTEIHNLAITGASTGLAVYGTSGVSIDQVWIHDTAHMGVHVWDISDPASITLSASLIEGVHQSGVMAIGADVTVLNSVVRDTLFFENVARGIAVGRNWQKNQRSTLKIHGSLLEKFPESGVVALESEITIDATVVRDIEGAGIQVITTSDTSDRAWATISQVTVDRTAGAGILISDSDAIIEASVVRESRMDQDHHGSGIVLLSLPGHATGKIAACTIDGSEDVGILVLGSDATIEATAVRNTNSVNMNANKWGVAITNPIKNSVVRSNATIRGTVIEDNAKVGIYVEGSDLTLEGTVVRGQGWRGLVVVDNANSGSRSTAVVRTSSIEHNRDIGVFIQGSNLTLYGSVVRNTLPNDQGLSGSGIAIQSNFATNASANALVQASLIEQNHAVGIVIRRANLMIEATVVRGTMPAGVGGGVGIGVNYATATIRDSLVDGNYHAGLEIAGSHVQIDSTIVRGTKSDGLDHDGVGIAIFEDDKGNRSDGTVQHSIIDDNDQIGLFVQGSNVRIEATIVRKTNPDSHGLGGRGLSIQSGPTGERAGATIQGSIVENNHEIGLFIDGSDVLVEATIVRRTNPDSHGLGGRGISIQGDLPNERSSAKIQRSIAENNHEIGLFIDGSDVVVEDTIIRDTQANAVTEFGDGIAVGAEAGPARATITDVLVERSERVSISNFGGIVELHSSSLLCSDLELSTQSWNGYAGTFHDKGDNHCGCPDATGTCRMSDVPLEQPQPLPKVDYNHLTL